VNSLAPGTVLSSDDDFAAMFSETVKGAWISRVQDDLIGHRTNRTRSLVTVKSGLLEIESRGFATGSPFDAAGDDEASHLYALENGT
jgi:hypothetical protein